MPAPLPIRAELKKLGLSDKEAAVYLAALELGPHNVQTISRKAKVARATTYLVLEGLMKQGLVTRFAEGQKTMFAAEPPRQLLRLIEKKEEELHEHHEELEDFLPQLQILMKSAEDQPTVRYFDGVEGLRAARSEIMRLSQRGDTWLQLSPADHMRAVFGAEQLTYTQSRKAKQIKSRAIIATKSEKLKRELILSSEPKWAERKFVDPKTYTSASGLTIFRNYAIIGTFAGKIGAVLVESESIATMLREFFTLTWNCLEKES